MRITTNTTIEFPSIGAPRKSPNDSGQPDIDRFAASLALARTIVPTASETQPSTQPNLEELTRAIELLQQKLQSAAPNLQFAIDQDTGQMVVKVIDSASNEVIRQIPPEEMLRLAKSLERMQEVLLSDSI